jgi:hypothetical protein
MDGRVSQTSDIGAYGQAVWSWRPDAGVKLVNDVTSDGG